MNPFTPGFGASPSLLVGREEVLAEVAAAFGQHPDPHRMTWLRAERGAGKTVLLNEIQHLAQAAGWLVVEEDAQSPGDLSARVTRRLQRIAPRRPRRQVKGVELTTPVGGASIELTDPVDAGAALRDVLQDTVTGRRAAPGVLITVDEVHAASKRELSEFGNAVQHLVRADLPVAAVVAGLPVVDDDNVATFLGRCVKPRIHELPRAVARLGLQETALVGNGGFSSAALELATEVTGGYPYMLQLVGYWSWKAAEDGRIGVDAVKQALPRCEHELIEAIAGLRAVRVSQQGEQYLMAMSVDDGPSRTSEIAARLGVSPAHAGMYRKRLIEAKVIRPVEHGTVDFTIPGHRSRLRVRAAQQQ